jgi:DNA-binding Lrp family transcriptional regulator
VIRTRLAELLDSGTVRVTALADPALVGKTTVAFLWVETWSVGHGVSELLAGIPEVMWASQTTAVTRTVAQISCASAGDLLRIVEAVRAHPSVIAATAELVLRSYVGPLAASTNDGQPNQAPLETSDVLWLGNTAGQSLDDLDHRVLDLLREDGRAGLTAIADAAEVPLTTVRRRVNRLLESDVVRLQCRVAPAALGYRVTAGVTVKVRRDAEALARFLATLPSTMWVSEVTGPYPITVELLGADHRVVDAALEQIRTDERIADIHVDYYGQAIKDTGRW